jgi:glycerophosphoryl diester phosphodiesterase
MPLSFSPSVIAHRGARGVAPENTMAAFRAAVASGARWIETDVKLTHDGVPILMHDETLDRTTNGHGDVAAMDWKDIQKLDAGHWFAPEFTGEHVPHMAELLRFALDHNMRLNLEIKPCPGRVRVTAMVALMETAKLWPRDALPPLISSFDAEALVIAMQMHPEWPRGYLFEQWPDDLPSIIEKTRSAFLGLDEDLMTDDVAAKLRDLALPFLVFTVNDPVRTAALLRLGASAVFSDDPHSIIQNYAAL